MWHKFIQSSYLKIYWENASLHNYSFNDLSVYGNNKEERKKEGQKWDRIVSLNQAKEHPIMGYI